MTGRGGPWRAKCGRRLVLTASGHDPCTPLGGPRSTGTRLVHTAQQTGLALVRRHRKPANLVSPFLHGTRLGIASLGRGRSAAQTARPMVMTLETYHISPLMVYRTPLAGET